MFSVAHLFVLSLAIILTEGGVSVNNPFYCYSQDPIKPQLAMFASNTAYETTRGRNIDPNVSTCNPSKFWMVARHGTRLPMASELTLIFQNSERIHTDILSYYDQGRTSLCASDFELLENWRFDPNITLADAIDLTSAGWNELEELAKRYQAAFPSILPSIYSPSDYFFRTTDTNRTQASLHAFADGLFGVNAYELVKFQNTPQPDYVLQAYTNCPLYNQVSAILLERDAFKEGPEYQEMTSQVSAKLGFHASYALRNSEVEMLALICLYEQIWDLNSTSPLCAAFSVANYQVLEYYWDLESFYRMGYGRPEYVRLFENLNCFLMQDMLRFIQSNDPNDHKARIFGSHLTSFFIVVFGVFKDDVLMTRHNFAQQSERLWKSSFVAPMAANLAVIRYDCADGDNDILFLYNERPLQIAGCEPNGLCKQSLILERFSRFLNANCMEVFCSNS